MDRGTYTTIGLNKDSMKSESIWEYLQIVFVKVFEAPTSFHTSSASDGVSDGSVRSTGVNSDIAKV